MMSGVDETESRGAQIQKYPKLIYQTKDLCQNTGNRSAIFLMENKKKVYDPKVAQKKNRKKY